MADDPMLREMTSRSEHSQGAGHRRQERRSGRRWCKRWSRPARTSSGSVIAEPWKKSPGSTRSRDCRKVDAGAARRHRRADRSTELAGRIGGKVDILINTCRAASHLRHRRPQRHRDRARRDGGELFRPVAAGAGVRSGDAARAAPTAQCQRDRLGEYAVDLCAVAIFRRTARSRRRRPRRCRCRRRCAPRCARRHPRRQRVSRPDRRRMEPAVAAAEAGAVGARQSHRRRAEATASRTSIPATSRRTGSRACRENPKALERELWPINNARSGARHATSWPASPPRSPTGAMRIIDLTQTLSPRLSADRVAAGNRSEPRRSAWRRFRATTSAAGAWYWNNISFGEHTGTHFDAPMHWIIRPRPAQQRDRYDPGRATSSRPPCVIDCSAEAARDADFLLTADICSGLGSAARQDPAALLGADAHRLVEAHRSGGLSEFRRGRPAHAGARSSTRCDSWCTSATCSASAPKPSAPTPARRRISCRPIRATTYMHGAGRYGLQCLDQSRSAAAGRRARDRARR